MKIADVIGLSGDNLNSFS